MAAAAAPDLNHLSVQNPALGQQLLDSLEAADSLRAYTKLVWDVIEPGRRLVYGWHMDVIGEHLEAVTAGEIKRLVINVPPGFSKSLLTNVLWPSWEWGPKDMPYLRYISFAYAQQLTIRDNRRCRNLITSPLYQTFWGDRFSLVSDQNAKIRYDTNQAGFRLASSVGGTGTGERGDRIVIDDPNNVRESESAKITESTLLWMAEVIPSRTTDIRTSAIVLIQQRTSVNDVTGHVLKSDLGYEWVCLPMEYEKTNPCYTPLRRPGVRPKKVRLVKLEEETVPRWVGARAKPVGLVETTGPVRSLTPQDRRTKEGELLDADRFPRAEIEQDLKKPLMSRGGHAAVAGQLQQRPQPRGGTVLKREWFKFVDVDAVPTGILWVRGYDLAGSKDTNSASAGVKIGVDFREDHVYIMDSARIREESEIVVTWMKAIAYADGLDVWIDFPQDPAQAGKWQRKFLGGKLAGYRLFSSPESGDKEDRAGPFVSQVKLGNVFLVRGPWVDGYIAEAITFPGGDFKDQIDATSRGYARALTRARGATETVGPKLIR